MEKHIIFYGETSKQLVDFLTHLSAEIEASIRDLKGVEIPPKHVAFTKIDLPEVVEKLQFNELSDNTSVSVRLNGAFRR